MANPLGAPWAGARGPAPGVEHQARDVAGLLEGLPLRVDGEVPEPSEQRKALAKRVTREEQVAEGAAELYSLRRVQPGQRVARAPLGESEQAPDLGQRDASAALESGGTEADAAVQQPRRDPERTQRLDFLQHLEATGGRALHDCLPAPASSVRRPLVAQLDNSLSCPATGGNRRERYASGLETAAACARPGLEPGGVQTGWERSLARRGAAL